MNQQILTKEFTLADVLGVISGYVLKDKGMDGIHSLIEWLAGDGVFTHQIPSVAPYCERALKKQFPQLDTDKHSSLSERIELFVRAIREKDKVKAALMWGGLIAQYGDSFQVAPLQTFDEYEHPPLITPNIKGKALIVKTSSDELPDSIDAA